MTRQQRWSRQALERVQAVAQVHDDEKKAYNTLCQKMPALIQRSGLVQAVVFVQARGAPGQRDNDKKRGARRFLGDLAAVHGSNGADALRARAQQAALPEYMALTRDLLDVSMWFRRFAQIELGDVED